MPVVSMGEVILYERKNYHSLLTLKYRKLHVIEVDVQSEPQVSMQVYISFMSMNCVQCHLSLSLHFQFYLELYMQVNLTGYRMQ